MTDGVEVDLIQLPEGVILAWAVSSMRMTGTEGEEHAVVVLDLQFQIGPGKVGQQAFIIHKDDANKLRAELKNPKTTETDKEETTT